MDVLAVVPDVAPELEAVVEEAAAPKVPFYKRDFSLKRGSSEPKQKAKQKRAQAEEGAQAQGRAPVD